MRVAVLSDIHACAQTYEIALRQAGESGCDQIFILGDLLTYGAEPCRTLDLTRNAVGKGAILILGNHDQIYIDHRKEGSIYENHLPDWIRESVDWTRKQIGNLDLRKEFDWRREWVDQDLLLAHANPFAYGDWTYLSSDVAFEDATRIISDRGLVCGVFGHTHRFRRYDNLDRDVSAVTVGSLGQPRNDTRVSEWSIVELNGRKISVERRFLDYSWESHLAALAATNMSQSTQSRLARFYLP